MRLLKQCFAVLLVWMAVSIFYAIRIPMGYKTFWAEDGALFYQEALQRSFLETLKTPSAGYLCLIGRISGKITSYFPVQNVTIVNFMLACFITALCIVTVYKHSRVFLSKTLLSVLVTIGLVFNPIATFDSLANSANLHFTLPFVLLVILIASQKNSRISLLSVGLIILACLSDPLCIFCFPALLDFKRTGSRVRASINRSVYSTTYLASMLVQFVFTAFYLSQGGRSIGQEHSFIKTSYLFLDRVVGSTFIPGWGRVTSMDLAGGSLTTKLMFRGALAAFILIFWVVLYLRLFNNKSVNEAKLISRDIVLLQLFVCSVTYWYTAGIIFNPEPRYGIFPALCLLMMGAVIIDRYLMASNNLKSGKFVMGMFCLTICATWVFSWAPSSYRITGPEWKEEFAKATKLCANSNDKSEKLQILPEVANWYVEIPCVSLRKASSDPN